MGECGCNIGTELFKLEAPNGWYIIEFLQGCKDCCTPPGIQIFHPESIAPEELGFRDMKDMEDNVPYLPVLGSCQHCFASIKCGLDPDEFKVAAIRNLVGTDIQGNKIDNALAEVLAEDLWNDALSNSPTVIQNIGDGI